MSDEKRGVRLDRWLWAARFYKTRSQASLGIKAGRVKLNGATAKAGAAVKPGHELTVRKGPYEFTVTVEKLSEKRGKADVARELYVETDDSIRAREETRERLAVERVRVAGSWVGRGRPTKKDRRALESFRQQFFFPEEIDDEDLDG